LTPALLFACSTAALALAAAPERDTYATPVADIPVWLSAHRVQGRAGGTCFEVLAGVPARASLLCRERLPGPRPRTVERILRPDDKQRLATVWNGVVGIYANWADLVVRLDPDGAGLELKDRVPCACDHARAEDLAKSQSQAQPSWLSSDLASACGARGRYAWSKNGRFVFAKGSAPAPCRETSTPPFTLPL
jgi:hypothetical protein